MAHLPRPRRRRTEPEPLDPVALREHLPTALTATVAIRDLYRILHYYPDALPASDAEKLTVELVTHLEQSIKSAGLEDRLAPLYQRPGPDKLHVVETMNNVGAALSEHYPEWDPDQIAESFSHVAGPVREIVQRLADIVQQDCRIPHPVDDPSYQEPRRCLQMLRHDCGACHEIILTELNADMTFRPHRLTPLIVNLKARILACCDALSGAGGGEQVRELIVQLVGVLLEGSADELDEDWTMRYLQQVSSQIEELRLELGGGTMPLTVEESLFLRHTEQAISGYREYLKDRWLNTLKRTKQSRAELERQDVPPRWSQPMKMARILAKLKACGQDMSEDKFERLIKKDIFRKSNSSTRGNQILDLNRMPSGFEQALEDPPGPQGGASIEGAT